MPTALTAATGLVALVLLRRSVVVKARRAEAERRRIARRARLMPPVEPSAHFLLELDGSLTQIVEDRRVRIGNREVWI